MTDLRAARPARLPCGDDPDRDQGRRYTDAQIAATLVRAGVVPTQRWLQQTRTVKGGQVAAAGTIGAGAIGRPFCEKLRLVDGSDAVLAFRV